VAFHYRVDIEHLAPMTRALDRLMAAGYLGVDLFFALSGFVLAYNYEDRLSRWDGGEVRGFLRNRVARVWPAHVVTLHLDLLVFLIGGIGLANGGVRRTLSAYWQNLTMTQDWFTDRPSFNSPAWSISAEWAAYLACPFLLLGLARIRRTGTTIALVVTTYAVMIAVYALWQLPNGNVTHGGLLRVAAGFVAGLLLQRIYRSAPGWLGRLTGPVLVAVSATILVLPPAAGGHYWLAPVFALLVLLVALDTGAAGSLLGRAGFQFWGEASYCLYLTHVLIRPLLHRIVSPSDVAASGWLVRSLVLVGYAAALAASALALHRLVEIPGRQRLRAAPVPRHT